MYPHRIHLREPWQRTDDHPRTLARAFNSPTGLEPQEAVWLVIERPSAAVAVRFNGATIGSVAASSVGELELTPLMRSRNEIRLIFGESAAAANFLGVRLEIRLKSEDRPSTESANPTDPP